MMDERFAEGNSPIHRSAPAVRVVSAVVYSFAAALTNDLAASVAALCFSAALAAAARLPILPLLKRLAPAAGLLLMIWAILPWSYPGDPLARLGPLVISRQGTMICLVITFKVAAILVGFTALVASMHLSTLGHALQRLGVPANMVALLLLGYRYVFVIQTEYQRLRRAARLRNFRPATNRHTYKTYAYLMGMLFVRAYDRAARVHHAMKCRGFNGRFHSMELFSATAWNPLLAAAVVLASAALIWIDIGI